MAAEEAAAVTTTTESKFIEKGYYALDFVKGKNPKLIVTSPESDKKINLAERNDIRIGFNPESLYANKFDKQAGVRVELFEMQDGKRKYISNQVLTLGRARQKVFMNMELGRFGKSSKDIQIDIYDTENRLVNTYSATITADFLGAQTTIASTELNSNPKAECTPGVFDDCYIEHILKRIVFEARAQQQISTRVLKSGTGEYIVTVPVPRNNFEALKESKFKAKVIGANGEVTGLPDAVFSEVSAPIMNIGDIDANYSQFKYDDAKKQLDLFSNGQEVATLSATDTGKFGIGTEDPAAFLDIRGGTTLIPQLRLRAGTPVSAPVNGVIEYDGADFYFTTNNVRKSLAGLNSAISGNVNASQITGVLQASQLPLKVVYTDTAQTVDSKTLTNTTLNGNIMIKNGATLKISKDAGDGKVLTSNASGVATWMTLPVSPSTNGTNFGINGETTTLIGESTTIQGSTAFAPSTGVVGVGDGIGNNGTLAVTQTIMRINGNGNLVTDLSTIDPQIAPGIDGQLLIIKCVAVVPNKIKFYDGRGLDLAGNGTFVTLDAGDTLTLYYDAQVSKWVEVSRSLN